MLGGGLSIFAAIETGGPREERLALTAKEQAQGYREHVILARPHPHRRATVDQDEVREGVRVRERFNRFGDTRVIELDSSDSAAAAIARLRATGRYANVEPDRILTAQATPDDTKFAQQWAYNNTGSSGRAGADIKAPAAWDLQHDAPDVIVAIIDTGARLTHPDLVPNLWRNPSPSELNDLHGIRIINGRRSGTPTDDNGHGSHVAGIVGAVGNNGSAGGGVTGVAWKVQLMILKFLGSDGAGTLSDELACLDYAITHGAHIINGSYGESGNAPQSVEQLNAINRAREAGIIFVAAAGNQAANMDVSRHYPASNPLDNIVAVGSSNRLDDRSTFTNYGSGAVELFAPGEQILSLGYSSDSSTLTASGTSMAAPLVSGALALLKQKYPTDTYRQLINRLLRGTDPLPAYAGKCQTGGRLNLLRALSGTDRRPFNDDFSDRVRLVGDNINTRANNAGATPQAGEPTHAGAAGGTSLWWEWTAPVTGTVNLDTSGSAYDTLLAVYTGNALDALTSVATNDNATSSLTSRIAFDAVAGTTYQIAVDGKSGAAGQTVLNVGIVPGNDAFAKASTLSGRSLRFTANNAQTSRETDEPRILGSAGGRSLWYRWIAPSTGTFQLTALSNDLDPLLAVYTGSSLNALTLVTAADALPSAEGVEKVGLCTINAVAGITYYITVDAKPGVYGVPTGQFTLSLVDSLWQSAAGDGITCAPAVAADGTIYVGGNDGAFYAFNPDGSTKWTTGPLKYTYLGTEYPMSFDSSSAAVAADGTVYVGGYDGLLRAYSPTGTLNWTFTVPTPTESGRYISIFNSPAIAADGTVYFRADDFYLYALNPADGTKRWRFDTGGSSYASPIIAPDGTIYIGSSNGVFYALRPDGTEKWRYQSTGEIFTTAGLDANGNIYFGTTTGVFCSLTSSSTLRWQRTFANSVTSSPALSADGSTLYFGGYDAKLHALATSDGAIKWSYALGDEVRASSPAIDANGVIYIGCYDNQVYAINPDGTPRRTYAMAGWVRSSPAISGTRLYVGCNDHKLYAFDIGTGSATGPWPQFRHNPRRTGRAIGEQTAIDIAPTGQTAFVGYLLELSVVASGPGPLSYQWKKDGVAIAGATTATFSVANSTAATAGSYTVTVTGTKGTVTSAPAVIVMEEPNPGRLINLSVRTNAGTGPQTLIVGFVLQGASSRNKSLLLRAIGPTLTSFGVAGAAQSPRLTLLDSNNRSLGTNNGWGGSASLRSVFNQVGAFDLGDTSQDAAFRALLGAGGYTVQIADDSGNRGIVLAEVYDADSAPTAEVNRLINLSARATVGTGGQILIAGFGLNGNMPKKLLIRGVGPTLGDIGVTGVLANPRLEIYRDTTLIHTNDNWSGTTTLRDAFTSVGAFALSSSASLDAALLVTLPPGSYTAQVSGVGNTTGVALIEVYEVP